MARASSRAAKSPTKKTVVKKLASAKAVTAKKKSVSPKKSPKNVPKSPSPKAASPSSPKADNDNKVELPSYHDMVTKAIINMVIYKTRHIVNQIL